ncbi:MAG: T9SS type A sorting domain-containing protein, partial [Saprospiraceae bacterium]
GNNYYGQLGNGLNNSAPNVTAPAQIGSDDNWQQLAAGLFHSAGIKTNGTLWTWGRNKSGQLGIGTYLSKSIPVPVDAATDWRQIAAGSSYNLAIKNDGTLWAWGKNTDGQLGIGVDHTQYYSPKQLACALTPTQSILAQASLKLFPNPAGDHLFVQVADAGAGDFKFEIRNLLGETLYPQQSLPADRELNINALSPGIYFVIISNQSSRSTRQFVKM